MRPIAVFLISLTIALTPMALFAADAGSLTESQKVAVKEIVRNMLTKEEPDLVIKAAQEMQNRNEKESVVKSQKALTENFDKIFKDPDAPIGGNPKGDVTLVEFYDYQCGYCKMAQETVAKILSEDKNVKLVYKEFPILGPSSVQVSKAALASVRQGKFFKFHEALMTAKEHLSEDMVMKTAKDVGLDIDKLKKDMADEKIEKIIKDNQEVGKDIGARGTPTFVIGEQVYPGLIPYEQMKKAIEDARKSKKK